MGAEREAPNGPRGLPPFDQAFTFLSLLITRLALSANRVVIVPGDRDVSQQHDVYDWIPADRVDTVSADQRLAVRLAIRNLRRDANPDATDGSCAEHQRRPGRGRDARFRHQLRRSLRPQRHRHGR